MYIVSQNGCGIVNSNHVTVFCIRSQSGVVFGDSSDSKDAAYITADYDGKNTYLTNLGGYMTFQKAHEVFQILLSALQDNASIFYMPQP